MYFLYKLIHQVENDNKWQMLLYDLIFLCFSSKILNRRYRHTKIYILQMFWKYYLCKQKIINKRLWIWFYDENSIDTYIYVILTRCLFVRKDITGIMPITKLSLMKINQLKNMVPIATKVKQTAAKYVSKVASWMGIINY